MHLNSLSQAIHYRNRQKFLQLSLWAEKTSFSCRWQSCLSKFKKKLHSKLANDVTKAGCHFSFSFILHCSIVLILFQTISSTMPLCFLIYTHLQNLLNCIYFCPVSSFSYCCFFSFFPSDKQPQHIWMQC